MTLKTPVITAIIDHTIRINPTRLPVENIQESRDGHL